MHKPTISQQAEKYTSQVLIYTNHIWLIQHYHSHPTDQLVRLSIHNDLWHYLVMGNRCSDTIASRRNFWLSVLNEPAIFIADEIIKTSPRLQIRTEHGSSSITKTNQQCPQWEKTVLKNSRSGPRSLQGILNSLVSHTNLLNDILMPNSPPTSRDGSLPTFADAKPTSKSDTQTPWIGK